MFFVDHSSKLVFIFIDEKQRDGKEKALKKNSCIFNQLRWLQIFIRRKKIFVFVINLEKGEEFVKIA